MKASKRKVLLINPGFQLRFISYFVACFFIMNLILLYSIRIFFNKFTAMGVDAHLEKGHIFFKFINEQHANFNLLFLSVSLVTLVFIAIGGIILSHKIAGPIHRFCNDISMMDKDNLKEIKFRKGDFFPEIAEKFNILVRKL